jgi:hypothetical protein
MGIHRSMIMRFGIRCLIPFFDGGWDRDQLDKKGVSPSGELTPDLGLRGRGGPFFDPLFCFDHRSFRAEDAPERGSPYAQNQSSQSVRAVLPHDRPCQDKHPFQETRSLSHSLRKASRRNSTPSADCAATCCCLRKLPMAEPIHTSLSSKTIPAGAAGASKIAQAWR